MLHKASSLMFEKSDNHFGFCNSILSYVEKNID